MAWVPRKKCFYCVKADGQFGIRNKKRTNFLRKKLVGSDSQLRITDYYRFHSENSFQWDNYNTFLEKNIPYSKVKSSQAEMKHVIYQISI